MTSKVETISADSPLECSVCLQTCIHPVQLPCRHIFCFLCVKGAANRSKRCALCRKEIPIDYFNHPRLVKISKELQGNESSEHEEKYSWYYEGRNGWWQYDERTNEELEIAYIDEKESIEILIAGFLYVIDFENMVQMRRNDPTRQRMIKRDLTCAPKKGVAGLKMQKTVKPEHKRRTCDGEDNRSDALTPTVRKSESTEFNNASTSQDPIYASSLQFTNIDDSDLDLPEFELSSHTFHPVSTDSARSYVNSASGDYPGPDWEQASSGYTSMVSARSSLTESLLSDNSAYEYLRPDISGAMQQTSGESSASNVNQPRKLSRNAKKRSGRMFTKEDVDLPTPSVYDTVTMTPATYLNDRRAEPLPTPNISNLDGHMSDLSINEPRRQSGRHLARTRPTLPVPPPLPRRTNSLNSQKDEEDNQGLPGRAVRQSQKKEPKPNVTHV